MERGEGTEQTVAMKFIRVKTLHIQFSVGLASFFSFTQFFHTSAAAAANSTCSVYKSV